MNKTLHYYKCTAYLYIAYTLQYCLQVVYIVQIRRMENYYRFQFSAHLDKLTLALKLPCEIEVHWKRGEKTDFTGRIPLIDGVAQISKKLTIFSNLVHNNQTKLFHPKITKFSIFLITEKGTKQAGEIQFDVSTFLNQKLKNKKYEISLNKCPDKNAKMIFTLNAIMVQQVAADAISIDSKFTSTQNTEFNKNISQKVIKNPTNTLIQNSKINKQVEQKTQQKRQSKRSTSISEKTNSQNTENRIKQLQQQNNKMKQSLKNKEKLIKENEQLKKILQKEEFASVKEIKISLQGKKKQIEMLKTSIINAKSLDSEIKTIQSQILKSKEQIMKAFNYAFEIGGSKLVNELQEVCGMIEDRK